ncbi:MAG: YraN family protein [Patescibacteria group bacterium]|nr:YraN family protein [Patescibacteria group bacterium]
MNPVRNLTGETTKFLSPVRSKTSNGISGANGVNYRREVGKFGENLAKNYLLKKGYEIIGENVKISFQEIDIIARQEKMLVFIEVKTRLSSAFGGAEDAFDFRKSGYLEKALESYIYKNNLDENLIRLDFISIDLNREKKIAKIKHYKDII